MTVLKKEERIPIVLTSAGEKVFSVLHRPLNQPSEKVVVTLHGFASSKIGTNRSYVRIAENLSEGGIATLRFDLRGCGDSEGSLSNMTPHAMLEDLFTVFKFLKEEGFSKMGVFGSSFGGFLAVFGAIKEPKVSTLALWAPVASGHLWYQDWVKAHPDKDPSKELKSYHGGEVSPRFRQEFEHMRADCEMMKLNEIPLLSMRGEEDEVLSGAHMEAFKKARKGSTATTRFITYPKTAHTLGNAEVFPQVVQEIVKWFQSTL